MTNATLSYRLTETFGTVRAVSAETYRNWRAHRVLRLGAGLAYYGLFALVPLLAIVLAIAGLLFDGTDIDEFLGERLTELLGTDVDDSAILDEAGGFLDSGSTQTTFGIVGVLTLLLSASLVFLAYQDALNVIFDAPVRSGVMYGIRRRLLAVATALLAGLLIIGGFALHTLVGLLGSLAPGEFLALESLEEAFGAATLGLLVTALFATLMRTLPDVQISWRPALRGAAVTAILLGVGAWGFGLYMDNVGVRSLGGAAGGVLVTLVFMYYQSQIILAGAVLTRTLHLRGSADEP